MTFNTAQALDKRVSYSVILTFQALAVLFAILIAPVTGIGQAAQSQGKVIPKLMNGKPDLGGVWDRPRVADVTKDVKGCRYPELTLADGVGCSSKVSGEVSYTPWGLEQWKQWKVDQYDYTAHCLPKGYTRSLQMAMYPVEILHTPTRLAILMEADFNFKVIPTDGRKHSPDYDASWLGESVGRYEGETLVVDTTGFNGQTWIDASEHLSSDQLHVVQRFRLIDANHLEYEVTFEDPKMYTKPFKNTQIWVRMKPSVELLEFVCNENNKDLVEGLHPDTKK